MKKEIPTFGIIEPDFLKQEIINKIFTPKLIKHNNGPTKF